MPELQRQSGGTDVSRELTHHEAASQLMAQFFVLYGYAENVSEAKTLIRGTREQYRELWDIVFRSEEAE